MANKPTISICTIMRNERNRVADFLSSLEGFADEIVVTDTGSSDGTLEALKEYGTSHPSVPLRVLTYSSPHGFHYGEAKNFALEQGSGEYVIVLDADERLSDEFKQKVREFLTQEHPDVASVVRQDALLPHLIDYPQRIIRRASGIRYGSGPRYKVHEQLKYDGKAARFSSVLLHDQKWNHYVTRPQRTLFQLELQIDRTPKTKTLVGHWLRGIWYFCFRFNKIYILRKLYRDGAPGFKYAFLRAVDAFLIEFFVGLKPSPKKRRE